jgi:hypothetical protein
MDYLLSLSLYLSLSTADEEVSQAVKTLPTRESLKGFKMYPLDFEKVRAT